MVLLVQGEKEGKQCKKSAIVQPCILTYAGQVMMYKHPNTVIHCYPVNRMMLGRVRDCSITLKSSRVPRPKTAETPRVPPGKGRRLTLSLLHRSHHHSGQGGLRHDLASKSPGNCKMKHVPSHPDKGVVVN